MTSGILGTHLKESGIGSMFSFGLVVYFIVVCTYSVDSYCKVFLLASGNMPMTQAVA